LSIKLMTRAWDTRGLTKTQKLLLLALADNANDEGVCWPSIANLIARCECSRAGAFESLDDLEKTGHVHRDPRPNKSTIYHVHPLDGVQPVDQGGPASGPLEVQPVDTESSSESPKESSMLDGLDSEAWKRWLDYRRKIKKPLKPASFSAAQKVMVKFGADQAAVVEQSIANGYQGLFGLKDAPAKVDAATGKPEVVRMYQEDPGGNLEIVKVLVSTLKPWEVTALRQLQKMYKSKTIFYRSELNDKPA
jgi:hypothetical protein